MYSLKRLDAGLDRSNLTQDYLYKPLRSENSEGMPFTKNLRTYFSRACSNASPSYIVHAAFICFL